MSRLTDRQLAHKLRPDSVPEPPAGLLDELRRQIPAEIQAPAPAQLGNVVPFRRLLPRSVWLAAASVVMLLGGGALSYLAVRSHIGLESAAEPDQALFRADQTEAEPGSPAEARDGSAGAMQPRDRNASGYAGAPSVAPLATAPAYPSRYFEQEQAIAPGGAAPQQRVSAPALRRADAPKPAAAPAPPGEPTGLAAPLELDREAEGARDAAPSRTEGNYEATAARLRSQLGVARQRAGASGLLELTLRDERGAALPGVTVTATGRVGERVAVTDAQGRAAIAALPSGQYRVAAELEGFETTVYPAVTVAGSRPTQVEAQLRASFEDVISVTAESPLADRRVSSSATVSSEQVAKVPVEQRPWRILRSTPGVLLAERAVGAEAAADVAAGDAAPASAAAAKTRAANAPLAGVSAGGAAAARAEAAAEPEPQPATAAPAPAAQPATVAPAPVAPPPPPGGNRQPSQRRAAVVFKSNGADPFVDSDADRLSAFTLDVGTGSYDVVRDYLAGGELPPPHAVRVEEVVNAFDYDDAAPSKGDFALTAEGALDPWAPGARYVLVRFAVKAREARRGVAEPVVARDARAQVEVDPRYVSRWRLLGYEDHDTSGERFRDEGADTTAAVRAGQSVSALYELELRAHVPASATLAIVRVRWRPTEGSEPRELHQPLRRSAVASSWDRASRSFRLATTVGRFAEVLRGSYWAKGDDLAEIERRLAAVKKDWPRQEKLDELMAQVSRARRAPAP